MSLRYGIKESDQLWVCCVFKSLCAFILFTLRGFHYLCSKSRHCSGCFPCFSLIPAAQLGPSPKPPLLDWLRLFRAWGFPGWGACEVFTVLFDCSHLQPAPFPCFHSRSVKLMALLFFSYCFVLFHTGFISLFLRQFLVCCWDDKSGWRLHFRNKCFLINQDLI